MTAPDPSANRECCGSPDWTGHYADCPVRISEEEKRTAESIRELHAYTKGGGCQCDMCRLAREGHL